MKKAIDFNRRACIETLQQTLEVQVVLDQLPPLKTRNPEQDPRYQQYLGNESCIWKHVSR